MRRAQTSTEYMILVAVVIVIAVVVSSILGDFPGIGSGTNKKVDDYKLTTSKVAVDDYGVFESENYTLVKIRNNHFDTLVANTVTMNGGEPCVPQNITLNTGQSSIVNCSGTITTTPDIQIKWTDLSTDASYTIGEVTDTPENPTPLVCDSAAAGGYFYNGDGSLGSPYGICNCTMLQAMENNLGANYQLLSDIDCSETSTWDGGKGFTPIGCSSWSSGWCGTRTEDAHFTGNFNGNYHSITGLYINRPAERFIGVFGSIYNSQISKVKVIYPTLNGEGEIGGLIGIMNESVVKNVSVNVSLSIGAFEDACRLGGIVGLVMSGLVDSSSVRGSLWTGCVGTGGIVAGIYEGNVTNSYSLANIGANREGSAGIMGYRMYAASSGPLYINNTYATGTYTAGTWGRAGGLAASFRDTYVTQLNISNSFSTITISGDTSTSGPLTCSNLPDLTNSYYTQAYSYNQGTLESGGAVAFNNYSHAVYADWDFTNIWDDFCENSGYPTLIWENVTSVTDCPGYSG